MFPCSTHSFDATFYYKVDEASAPIFRAMSRPIKFDTQKNKFCSAAVVNLANLRKC